MELLVEMEIGMVVTKPFTESAPAGPVQVSRDPPVLLRVLRLMVSQI